VLKGISFFQGLTPEALDAVVRSGRTHRLPKDAVLFEQGAEAAALHLLLHGRLKVAQTAADGQQVVLRFVGPNELAGVFALLGAGQPYPATVSAVVDCVVLSWDQPAVQAMLRDHPQVALNVMRTLGGRTLEAHDRLRAASAQRVEQRLALALLRLIRQAGVKEADGSITIDFPLARQDLAEMAGTTLHTASRVLSGWEQAGILGGGRLRVVVRNPHALMRISEG
jgi:CRP-like cAMP-binding protein